MPRSLNYGHIEFFPVVAGRMEFAIEVRKRILRDPPSIIALELPLSMRGLYLQAINRLPELSIITRPDPFDPGAKLYIPVEPTDPFIEAIRTSRELGIDLTFIEPDCGDRPHIPGLYPDSSAIRTLRLGGYINEYREHLPELTDEAEEQASGMAWKLQGSNPERKILAIVSLNLVDATLELLQEPQSPPIHPHSAARRLMTLSHLDPDSLAGNTVEMPLVIERYEKYRQHMADPNLVNRRLVQQHLLRDAELRYVKSTGCPLLDDWQRAQVIKFARNLALSSGGLTPTLFDLVAAAQAIVDDDYAFEVRKLAGRYECQKMSAPIPMLKLPQASIWDRKSTVTLRPTLIRLDRTARATQPTPLDKWLKLDPVLAAHRWDSVALIFDEDRANMNLASVATTSFGACYEADGQVGGLLWAPAPENEDDFWSRPEYDAAESKAERLLLAAVCRSQQIRVIYIAPHPPRALMKSVAAHLGRAIVYIPIGQLPPSLLDEQLTIQQ